MSHTKLDKQTTNFEIAVSQIINNFHHKDIDLIELNACTDSFWCHIPNRPRPTPPLRMISFEELIQH
ncbi:hypothetical protein EV681_1247 [Advenella incenata]|uniref:Uncharacterized protein n=1 Tax=Advenella incenata TaxID=267800 RepID=A0A4Q7VSE2_9BURK|nr:hypothetical protein EV681_1247 [Advenella incenata]